MECLKTGNWLKDFSIVHLKSGKSLTDFFMECLKTGNWLKDFSIVRLKSGKGFDRFVLCVPKIENGLILMFEKLAECLEIILCHVLEFWFCLGQGIKLKTAVFLRVKIYTVLDRNQTQDY